MQKTQVRLALDYVQHVEDLRIPFLSLLMTPKRFLGGDLFMVKLKDKFGGNEKATGNVEDRGDGSYLATYTVPADAEPGDYMLNVCLDGVHIHGSPFAVTCFSAL